jgi:signal transduction histidine kinase
VRDLLESVSFVSAPLAHQKQLEYIIKCDGLDAMPLVGAARDLKRILGNLTANAINYTTTGSITLSASRVTSHGHAGVMLVLFSVTDTGSGISKSEQNKMWLPYVRGGMAPSSLAINSFFISLFLFSLFQIVTQSP